MKKSTLFACIALMALSVSTAGWCADPNPQSDPNKPTQEQSKKKTRSERWGETKKQKQTEVATRRDADAQRRAEKAVTDHGLSSDTSSKDLAKALDMTESERRAYEERLGKVDSEIDAWEKQQKAPIAAEKAAIEQQKQSIDEMKRRLSYWKASWAMDNWPPLEQIDALEKEIKARETEAEEDRAAREARIAELEAENAEAAAAREAQMQEDRKILEEGKSAMALGNMTPEEYLKAYREAEKKSGGDKGLARKGAFTAAAKSALLGQSSSSVVYKNRQKGIVDWAKSVPNVGSAEDTFINGYFQEEMGDTLETAKGHQGQKKRD